MEIKEILVVLRNIFYKCFLIGLFFLTAAIFLYMPCRCALAKFYQSGLGINTELYYAMWVSFIGLIKTVLIFLFLVPALAVHWAENCYGKKQQEIEETEA